jgi:hypothetical protein
LDPDNAFPAVQRSNDYVVSATDCQNRHSLPAESRRNHSGNTAHQATLSKLIGSVHKGAWKMSKLLKAVAGASLLVFTATTVIAQGTPNTSSGQNQPGQGSSDSNAVKNEKPTDPNLPSKQPEPNKLQKDERTGKSTGG